VILAPVDDHVKQRREPRADFSRVPDSAVNPAAAPRPFADTRADAAGTGVALQIILDHLHPHHEQPNNSVAAFTEYAHAQGWAAIHIGQFVGVVLLAFALLVLCRSPARQPGLPGALAGAGAVAVVVLASVFAVQMAVDGVA
jgi:hypothetical protein